MKKVTFSQLILGSIYGTACFFTLGLILRFSITYLYTKGFDVSHHDILKTFIMSCIAGVGASLASYIFAKIDERKKREKPPSDPKA
ncbi:DUF3021 family protein [Leclercia sp.]|uniref:DUF3021 family protein n=1 Tax=Leclercia sp. TaxID=1898428 RepID=UPI00289CD08D|nr:DUF3021 family protein [Leclercia sp.]